MQKHEHWSSKIGFVLAAAGSAIGLGAIWKLPYVTGTSGGGAFFLVFVLLTLLLGLPLLLTEFIIGKRGQTEAIGSHRAIHPKWGWLGKLGVVTNFLMLSFYSVLGGWVIIYLIKGLSGKVIQDSMNYREQFESITTGPWLPILAQGFFLLLTALIVGKGVENGIEKATKILMPALFILFVALIIRSLTLDNAMEGVKFFLAPDFSALSSEAFLFALGQSFFALSLGSSIMVTYASYLPRRANILQPAVSITSMSLVIALMAGLAIFPAVFSLGFEPAEGSGLLFVVLPAVFEQLLMGELFFVLFMFLLLFATITSAIGIFEVIVATGAKDDKAKRKRWAYVGAALIFAAGIPSALSYGELSHITIFGKNIFDSVDYLVSYILLPIGAMITCLLVTSKVKRDILKAELLEGTKFGHGLFMTWFYLVRYLIPVVVVIVMLNVLGFI